MVLLVERDQKRWLALHNQEKAKKNTVLKNKEEMMKRWEQAIVMSVVVAVVIGMMVSCKHLETSEKDIADSNDVVVKLGDGIAMRLKPIPAGDFTMGSPDDEKGRENGEIQHRVTLTKDF